MHSFRTLFLVCCLFCLQNISSETPEIGIASYYAKRFHGRRTASGVYFDQERYSAAHRSLPFGTFVRVTNLSNNKATVVKIIDRGPHSKRRLIDLSYAAAEGLDMILSGLAKVKVEVIGKPSDFKITRYLVPPPLTPLPVRVETPILRILKDQYSPTVSTPSAPPLRVSPFRRKK